MEQEEKGLACSRSLINHLLCKRLLRWSGALFVQTTHAVKKSTTIVIWRNAAKTPLRRNFMMPIDWILKQGWNLNAKRDEPRSRKAGPEIKTWKNTNTNTNTWDADNESWDWIKRWYIHVEVSGPWLLYVSPFWLALGPSGLLDFVSSPSLGVEAVWPMPCNSAVIGYCDGLKMCVSHWTVC